MKNFELFVSLFIFIANTSCATVIDIFCSSDSFCVLESYKHDKQFDKVLNEVSNNFKKYDLDIKIDTHRIPVSYTDKLEIKSFAACLSYLGRPYGIVINKKRLKQDIDSDTTYANNLLFLIMTHEIGHCYFDTKHDYELVLFEKNIRKYLNVYNDNYGYERRFLPKSLMYPFSINVDDYLENKEYYDREFVGLDFTNDENKVIEKISGLKIDGSVKQGYELVDYVLYNKSGHVILRTNDYIEFYNRLHSN